VNNNNPLSDEELQALLIRLTVAVEEILSIVKLRKPLTAEDLINGK
jgi:hypothetical protein